MGVFFGTDGIRGVVNEDLNFDIAYRCGHALASEGKKVKIIIGRDTRVSGTYLTLAFAVGAMNAGADVVDVGVIPMPTSRHHVFILINAIFNECKFNTCRLVFVHTGIIID